MKPVQVSVGNQIITTIQATHNTDGTAACQCTDQGILEQATLLMSETPKKRKTFAVVHRIGHLLDLAAGTLRQAFRKALSGLQGDPDHLSQLIHIVEKAILTNRCRFKRFRVKTGALATPVERAQEVTSSKR
jgi:hypothetical protein